ncbi:MAG: PilZ domain-containing protein [Pseudomonadota bacterium]
MSSQREAADNLFIDDQLAEVAFTGPDRRLDDRVTMSIPCTFVLGNGEIVCGQTENLSASGVAIASVAKPAPGGQIHLHFESGGVHPGEITRLFDGGFAVKLSGSSLEVLALTQDEIVRSE